MSEPTPLIRDPAAPPATFTADERFYLASQWRLMWWKFLDHKVAVAALWILVALYLVAIFCEFFAPHDPLKRHASAFSTKEGFAARSSTRASSTSIR